LKTYQVNEIFYSLQGEGRRAGTPNVFVRFSGCNLTCSADPGDKSPGGFDCDTEFASGRPMRADEIVNAIRILMPTPRAVILTGGEPLLQVDGPLVTALKEAEIYVAVETNGTFPIPLGIDWVSLSPKVAEHAIRADWASEVRYVRHEGQGIPKPRISTDHKFLSPGWSPGKGFGKNLEWCLELAKQYPEWSLSIQQHKIWGVR